MGQRAGGEGGERKRNLQDFGATRLFVFGVGFAFNILVWMPEDTFNWDVLTFVGSALMLLNFARHVPLPISILIAAIAVLISPVLQGLADYKAYWVNLYFECDLTLSDVTIGYLVTGYFPIFPWIAFSLCGFVTASLLFAEREDPSEELPPVWPMVSFGTAFALASFVAIQAGPYLPPVIAQKFLGGWHMFPPTVEYVLGTLGWTLILLGVVHYLVDRNPKHTQYKSFLGIARTFSRYSFTIYILHHIVHLWPLWMYGVWTGNEPTHFWTNAMSINYSLPLALVFLVRCYGLLRWLGPDRAIGIEAAMRWLCD